MKRITQRGFCLVGLASACVVAFAILPPVLAQSTQNEINFGSEQKSETPAIPKVWDDRKLTDYRLPLAGLGKPPTVIDAQRYYALPESNRKTYPVYVPDREPAGYLDYLKSQKPQPLVEISKLKSDADWIAAGREVFYGREIPRFTGNEENIQLIRNPAVLKAYRLPTTKDGVILGLRYVVTDAGKVTLGTDTCAMCHVQVRPDGSLIEGAPNNTTPFGPLMGDLTRRYAKMGPEIFESRRLRNMREDYRVPFLKDDPNLAVLSLPIEKIADLYDSHPLGVQERTNTSLLYPVKIANLIGIKNLHYFDRTATSRHRDIGDLMRYCALVGDVTDALTLYGDGPDAGLNLNNMGLTHGVQRTPDPLLYALARYLYSLKPPLNPNIPLTGPGVEATAGGKVFGKAGCAQCHTPPAYTNNRLTPVDGLEGVMKQQNITRHQRQSDLMPISVGTDPNLALQTRKGTGYYRVPTLRMLWLYPCYLHDGSIGSLEEMFDPARLNADFRACNQPPNSPPHAVTGHAFGLNLSPTDRKNLVAFLKTL